MRAIKSATVHCAVLVAVCGLGLLAVSASASAASWKVESKTLEGETKLAETTKIATTIELSIPSHSITIKCKTVVIVKNLTAPITLVGTFTFTECTNNVSSCELPSIKTTTLVSTATTVGTKEVELSTKPKVGTTVATLEPKGSKCPLGPTPIEGSFTLKSPEGQVEQAEHELSVSSTSLKAKIGEETPEVTFKGAIGVKLASGKTWSFR